MIDFLQIGEEQMEFETNFATRPLLGQTAIVTGAARGIGQACAYQLAKAGANVIVHYHTSRQQAQTVVAYCKELGVQAYAFAADVTKQEDIRRLADFAGETFEQIDILINNAGVSHTNLLIDTTYEQWQQLIATNLTGPYLLTKSVLPAMIRQNYGRIVNISSIWGMTGGSCEVAYSASKGGILAFTKALAKELSRAGITVNAVAPGAIDTDMISELTEEERMQLAEETPVGRLGTADDVAHVVHFLCLPSSSFITGQVLSPNGGFVI
ncbi:SDR family oxidoreductase [Fodinisporobacter ferrooxydans]|uniref:SDR family oxidoreductase n=1 Tax=Fodinisporobacter ferrooxydans TaxID=2901836 RepID=A0ABY4CFF5_9BACL|nr:SDR family oxidoreductase [Alicyclobacillaceae bacterium MYW30-H2]